MSDPIEFAKALNDETRQRIMRIICCRELCVSDIVKGIGLSQPTVSHHLGILRNAGLVKARKEGKQVYYTLDQEIVRACCGTIMRRFAPEQELIVKRILGD
jgi:DNA-binding transcriptional ArsR family regulator